MGEEVSQDPQIQHEDQQPAQVFLRADLCSACLKTRATGPVGEAPNACFPTSRLVGKQAFPRVPDCLGAPEGYGDWQVLREASLVTRCLLSTS